MSKKGKKRVVASLVLMYVLLSITWIVFLFVQQSSTQKTFNNQLAETKIERDSIEKRAGFLLDFLIVDNNYILGDYEKSIAAYKLISSNPQMTPFEEDLLALRVQRIEEILNNQDLLSADIEAYQFSLNAARLELASLKKEKDSLLAIEQASKEGLQNQITALKSEIAEKNKELNRKEKIQVLSFQNDKGNTIHYLGEVKNGMANGGGVGIFDTGGLYKGAWKDNQRHGEGTYTWKDGHKYEGTFVEGVREGKGTYYWSSGEKYVGQWSNNMRNGKGILYDRDNNISYEGLWVDDKVKK